MSQRKAKYDSDTYFFLLKTLKRLTIFCFSLLGSTCLVQTFYAAELTALTFNVQNLFDGVENGTEYTDYQEGRWGTPQYEKRLKAIGKALQSLRPSPNILAFQEVENEDVVRDLQRYYLPRMRHLAISKKTDSAIQVAVLSSYAIEKQNTHQIHDARSFRVRPVLEVELRVPGLTSNTLQLLVVHFKSKRPTGHAIYTSDAIREYQFRLLYANIDPQIPSLIMGDFNDELAYEKLFAQGRGDAQTQLVDPLQHYTRASPQGSYYYQSQWIRLDHVLFDRVFLQHFSDVVIQEIRKEPFVVIQEGTEKPNSFYRYRNNFDAVSDHLPLMVQGVY